MWLSIIPIAFIMVLLIYAWRADQYDLADVMAPLENSVVYDCKSRLIGTLTDEARINVTRAELPQDLVNAFVAREDEDFFDHGGIVYSSIIRSIFRNLSTMSYAQGGSTITMQLARNCYELGGKTLDRKMLEMAVARRIESKYDKDEILTAYLNRIYFGQQCYGIAQAAERYFGKKTRDLTLSECATLAGLVRGPSIFNPEVNLQAALTVRNETLERMLECGFISAERHRKCLAEPLKPVAKRESQPASYPVLFIGRELAERDGKAREDTSSIKVLSSFDMDAQRTVELVSESYLMAAENAPLRNGLPKRTDNDVRHCLQAAVWCINSRTGQALAITGGRSVADGVDRWQRQVKPGVLFAPVVNICAVSQGRTVLQKSPEVTGRGVGFTPVIEVARQLGFSSDFPRAPELYKGEFLAPLSEITQALYRVWRNGRNMRIYSVVQIGTTRKNLVEETAPNADSERKELVPHEIAMVTAGMLPYMEDPGYKRKKINCALPSNMGNYSAMFGPDFCVFVWIGFDKPDEALYKKKGVKKHLFDTCANLSKDIYKRMVVAKQNAAADKKGASGDKNAAEKESDKKKQGADADKRAPAEETRPAIPDAEPIETSIPDAEPIEDAAPTAPTL